MSEELKCPLCYKDYYSHECPHNFQQMEQDINALRIQLNEVTICRDSWKNSYEKVMKIYRDMRREQLTLIAERDTLKAKLDIAVEALKRLEINDDVIDFGIAHEALKKMEARNERIT